jgi:hypothetical protein
MAALGMGIVKPSMKGSEPEAQTLGPEPIHLGLAPRVRGWPRATSAAGERNPWFRYRLKVKLDPVHQGRPERLIYELDGSTPTKKTTA